MPSVEGDFYIFDLIVNLLSYVDYRFHFFNTTIIFSSQISKFLFNINCETNLILFFGLHLSMSFFTDCDPIH